MLFNNDNGFELSEGYRKSRRNSSIVCGISIAWAASQFELSSENFISEASRLIQEQKATVIIEQLTYDAITETHDIDIFTDSQSKQDFSKAGDPLKRHIYDYVITDSKTERTFVQELDTSSEIVVYAKLPRVFSFQRR